MSVPKQRRGIVTVSLGLLEQWLRIPPGTSIVDVRSVNACAGGSFEILLEGEHMPETPAWESPPAMHLQTTVFAPRVEFIRKDDPPASCDMPGCGTPQAACPKCVRFA